MTYRHITMENTTYGRTISETLNQLAQEGWRLMGPVMHVGGCLFHATFVKEEAP